MVEALVAGGQAFLLPQGAQPVPAQRLRPAPLAAPGLLGIAVIGGQALPVMAAQAGLPGGDAWVVIDGPGGRLVVVGEALLDAAPPGALPLAAPRIAARPVPVADVVAGSGWAVPARAGRARLVAMAAEIGGLRLVLPFAALERVVPLPAMRPAPGAGPAALGYAVAAGAPVLVLDPAWVGAAPLAEGPPPGLLVLFRHAGRRLGLPCHRIEPARPGEATLVQRLDAAMPELAAAPLGQVLAPPVPEPVRALLVCAAGGQPFALPVEEVQAVIPPTAPSPAPEGRLSAFRGVTAHRGDVLPVLDAGERLGLGPVLAAPGAEAPLLRLAGARPVALAVSVVTGLRRIPERLIAAVAGDGLVAAIAEFQDAPLPVCRAAVLGAAP
ncbi:chemotaxis protein CheW [Falsiroseomonas ponticola]|uniref:chemotaxis protein CheW n=1 Tax=Falsiroseomonas ponticola TaxID=2786951 RepID=UPI0019327F8E|nr:chemotaxis protein CheW [Roseomonas ponticola]